MNATQLPSEIQTSLLNQIYPSKYGQRKKFFFRKHTAPYTIKDIQTTHKDAADWFTSMSKNQYDPKNIRPEDITWAKEMLKIIKDYKLFGILAYGNGDTAWYSFRDKKVYDFNHELGLFNIKPNRQMHRPAPYKQWANEVLSEKRYDAFKGPKSWQRK